MLTAAVTALMAAAGDQVAGVLTDLFVVLLAAKLGDALFRRLDQPGIVGQILAGAAVGPSVLAFVEPTETLHVFAELGVVFLLFWVGLETRVSEIREVGRAATLVGVLGVLLSFTGGFALAVGVGERTATAIFIGVALVATSVGITSAVLVEAGALATRAGKTILGAAVIDDILAMLLLAVAVSLVREGGVDVSDLVLNFVLAAGFVGFFAVGGTRLVRRQPQVLQNAPFEETPLLPAVVLCLGMAALAAHIGLAAIIGAFLAGMIVAETNEREAVQEQVAPLYAVFPPFFFAFIGTQLQLDQFGDLGTLALLAGLTALAVVTKYAGGRIGARDLPPGDARVVAIGMVPRGEVGIIVASIATTAAVIDEQLFAVVIGMSVLTTLLTPPLLRRALAVHRANA